jgi:glutaredoxin/predicted RNA-binding Zn-ribbon protein involved in translation (DUF1610 family)
MPTTCPKCRHVRHASDSAPEWQCPACGVVYAKAADSDNRYQAKQGTLADTNEPRSMSWVKAIAIVASVFVAWQGLQIAMRHRGGLTSIGADLSNEVSAADLAQLAANVNRDEVVIYTTTQCPYCKQAKAWMQQYGFPFTECDAQVHSECARDLDDFGSDGVPYLIVRGKHLKDGFNSNEFIAALRQDSP